MNDQILKMPKLGEREPVTGQKRLGMQVEANSECDVCGAEPHLIVVHAFLEKKSKPVTQVLCKDHLSSLRSPVEAIS